MMRSEANCQGHPIHPAHPHLAAPLAFAVHLLRNTSVVILLVSVSLGVGAVGYHEFEKLGWLDATLNATMILTGMGPIHPVTTTAGKLFAIGYALFSGVAFLSMAAILVAPAAHRFLRRFHLELARGGADDARAGAATALP